MPVGDRLRLFTNYAASFDTRLRNPRWVLEHVNAGQLALRQGSRTNSEFVEDAGEADLGSAGGRCRGTRAGSRCCWACVEGGRRARAQRRGSRRAPRCTRTACC